MADREIVAFNPDTTPKRLETPQDPTDRYIAKRPTHFEQPITTDSTIDGRDIAADGAKLDFATITQAVDLDAIEARVNALDASVVLKGGWDASSGIFPVSTVAGESWIVTVAATVDGIDFEINDRILAIIDGASTLTYIANWLKLDYTDQVISVNGHTGAVVLVKADIADLINTLEAEDLDSLAKLNALVLDATLGDQSDFATAAQGVLAATAVQTDGSTPLTANWDLGSFDVTMQKLTADSIQLDLAAAVSVSQGQMAWNVDEETVDIGLNGAVLQVGQETHYHVTNNTGVTILDGKAVMAVGTVGASGKILVDLMDGSVITNGKYFLGIATEEIATGTNGKITSFGKIRGIKTDYAGWTEGTVLWVDNAIPGNLTHIEPTSGCRLPVAFVITVHATNGTLAVRASDGTYLKEAHDTEISSPSVGDGLRYNGTVWVNEDLSALPLYLNTGITAYAGGGQTNAVLLAQGYSVLGTVATAGDSVKLPSATAGKRIKCRNEGDNYADVFPNTSDKVGLRAIDIAFRLYPGTTVELLAMDNERWEIQ